MTSAASGMLGILNRAKAVAYGPEVEGKIRKGFLLLLAKDASPRSLKELRSLAETHGVPVVEIGSKSELGAPLGKAELTAVLILSKKGAASFKEKLQKGEEA